MNIIKIFVSYSHQNSAWVDDGGKYNMISLLNKRLALHNVVFWTDHTLNEKHVGEEYKKKIKEYIDNADIALLMISPYFAASEFITTFELPWIKDTKAAEWYRKAAEQGNVKAQEKLKEL